MTDTGRAGCCHHRSCHRTHTEAILFQTRAAVEQNLASDEWAYYQAKKINSNDTELNENLLWRAGSCRQGFGAQLEKNTPTVSRSGPRPQRRRRKGARTRERRPRIRAEVEEAEHKANYFDFGEALLEIGLVIQLGHAAHQQPRLLVFRHCCFAHRVTSVVWGLLIK